MLYASNYGQIFSVPFQWRAPGAGGFSSVIAVTLSGVSVVYPRMHDFRARDLKAEGQFFRRICVRTFLLSSENHPQNS